MSSRLYSAKTTVWTGIISVLSRLQTIWMLLLFDFCEFIDVSIDVMGDF